MLYPINNYKIELIKLASKYPIDYRGKKYIEKWDHYWNEKQDIINNCNLINVKTALDIGTGIGILPYQLMQLGIEVEGTDIEEAITGSLFIEARKLIGLKTYLLYIKPSEPVILPKKYDLITATRTEFDRQDNWNWEFFINDCFNYCNQLFIKTNIAGSTIPKGLKTYNPFKLKSHEGWCIHI